MRSILKRISSLAYLARPLALTFVGVVLLSLGVAYVLVYLYRTAALPEFVVYLTLQFIQPLWVRGLIVGIVGLTALGLGIWKLSGVVVIPIDARGSTNEVVLGYERINSPAQVVVVSGGPGMLVLAGLGRKAQRLTCITPVQDPVEYYYRAASLFHFENVLYVVPTPTQVQVFVELDDGTRHNIKQNISHDDQLAARYVTNTYLGDQAGQPLAAPLELTRQATETLSAADTIILGPGSLFESIVPNLLIPGMREAIKHSRARKIYVCNLMTEPGMTTNFSVADHIRQIVRFGGFTPNYVLVNIQRIDQDIRQLYQAANQRPVYLTPEEYEETAVSAAEGTTARDVIVEGAVVIEADLASSVVQSVASIERPGEVRAIRVLRHDSDKLTAALMEVMRRP